jgi:hypothetical protein
MNLSKRLEKVEKIVGKENMVMDELINGYAVWLKENPGRPTDENPNWDFSEWLNRIPEHLMPAFYYVMMETMPHLKKRWAK